MGINKGKKAGERTAARENPAAPSSEESKVDGNAGNVEDAPTPSDQEERRRRITEAAYYRAERRGFAPGYEEADWLEAEKQIDAEQNRALGK